VRRFADRQAFAEVVQSNSHRDQQRETACAATTPVTANQFRSPWELRWRRFVMRATLGWTAPVQ
jgi:hypothetical protein